MLRSMFTAIGALNLHQSYLDVVANNLANANTIGYKAARMIFHDQFSQLMSPGSNPTATAGGRNPVQIGLGVQVGTIAPVFTQGMLQSTGRNMDVAIEGDGFLIYNSGGQRRYSREGSLTLDAGGFLVNSSSGQRVQGWTATGGVVDTNLAIGDIQVPTSRTIAQATTTGLFGGNLNSTVAVGATVDTTMSVYNSLGNTQNATVRFTRTGPDAWSWAATAPATGAGTITFDPASGQVASSTGGAITVPGGTGANTINMTLDVSKLTMLSTPTSAAVTSQNGLPAGNIVDAFITSGDGSVNLVYSNGMHEVVGQVAIARFTNPSGLMRAGETSFQEGLNSGEPQIGSADTGGRGTIAAGYLEGSNVDMAQEFTNMILAQRGFQASSRVITTSDEIIQELVNLKR